MCAKNAEKHFLRSGGGLPFRFILAVTVFLHAHIASIAAFAVRHMIRKRINAENRILYSIDTLSVT